MDSAACFACLPEDVKQTLKLQLLCEILNGGGGGGGGVTSAIAGNGISVDQATGAVTISNSGVIALLAGAGIAVDQSAGTVTIDNAGVTSIIAGDGINIDQSTGDVTISVGPPSGSGLVPIVTNNTGDAAAGLWNVVNGYVRQYGNTVYATPGITTLQVSNSFINGFNGVFEPGNNIPSVTYVYFGGQKYSGIDITGAINLATLESGPSNFVQFLDGIGSAVNQEIILNDALVLTSITFDVPANLERLTVDNAPLLISFSASATTSLSYLRITNAALSQSVVNSILVDLDSHGILNGTVNLSGQTPAAPPSGAGITAAANLVINGWTVTTD